MSFWQDYTQQKSAVAEEISTLNKINPPPHFIRFFKMLRYFGTVLI